ncbi:MAG: OadG family protein [Bacteroidales bacterium]|nr:OadG family protein [Bacteroidales bacterium]
MIAAEIGFDLSNITAFGISLAIVGYVTVFSALALLYYAFSNIPRIINFNIRKKLMRQGKHSEAQIAGIQIPGEENAAISLALYMFLNEVHDEENKVLTIKNIRKEYSPWSSKIYNINRF